MPYLPVPTIFDTTVDPQMLPLLDANFAYVSGKIPHVKDYGAKGDGITDDTAAIQLAINLVAGKKLDFTGGTYKITAALNVLKTIHLYSAYLSATIVLATQNQNGIVIGDGTAPTAALVNNTMIEGLQFTPASTSSSFTSGAYISINYASFFTIQRCNFYGADSSVTQRMWDGLDIRGAAIEWKVQDCIFQRLRNSGIRTVGSAGLTVTDGNITNCLFTATLGDFIVFGDYTAAITVLNPTMYQGSGWGIRIDITPATGVGFNFWINNPDIEATTTTSALGAVLVHRGFNVQINGGWFGGTVGFQVDSGGSSVQANNLANFALTPAVISGPSCSITGGDIAGDNATTTTGVLVNSGATDFNMTGTHIRQFITQGIQFAGSPARCIVNGVSFRANALNVTGDNTVTTGPEILDCSDDTTPTLNVAATLPLRHGMKRVNVNTSATHITAMTPIGRNSRVTLVAAGGSVLIDNTGNIVLKGGANATITTGTTMDLICDGVNWNETARSF